MYAWLVPSRLKFSLLINYLLEKRLGYARGEDGMGSFLPSRHPLR